MTKWLIRDRVEVVVPRSGRTAGPQTGYDLLLPIGPGDREPWMTTINVIYLRGVPRALRSGARVYLKQGREVFWSAPILEVLSDAERVSDITGEDHGSGPNLLVDLDSGRRHRIDAAAMDAPTSHPWHTMQGFKYVTPGCRAFVQVGPKQPTGAMRSRSSVEVAVESALAKHLEIDRDARVLRLHDGRPRPVVEVDVCSPLRRLVVEYDGAYFHADRIEQDKAKTKRLTEAGLLVMRLREEPLELLGIGRGVRVNRRMTADDMVRLVIDRVP